MPLLVVDPLEAVDVDEGDDERLPSPVGALEPERTRAAVSRCIVVCARVRRVRAQFGTEAPDSRDRSLSAWSRSAAR
ncbi:MAG: hypothetical protein WKF94_11550 [Solirubrobacteraceae bacterium]